MKEMAELKAKTEANKPKRQGQDSLSPEVRPVKGKKLYGDDFLSSLRKVRQDAEDEEDFGLRQQRVRLNRNIQ